MRGAPEHVGLWVHLDASTSASVMRRRSRSDPRVDDVKSSLIDSNLLGLSRPIHVGLVCAALALLAVGAHALIKRLACCERLELSGQMALSGPARRAGNDLHEAIARASCC